MAKTILVVDDEAPLRLLMSKILEDAGYKVLTAASGLEALKVVDVSRPDLVVADINMPDLDGIEMASGLRFHDSTKTLPIIFVTASDSAAHLKDTMTVRARFVLRKPFSNDKLVETVRMAVGA